jgi:hypothetical protein
VALAPSGFGSFGGDLLVGNFGDGHINAFNPKGRFVGTLADGAGKPITIKNLWALRFGNGGAAGSANTLFFTAGLTDAPATIFGATDGLLGSLQAIPQLKHKAHALAHIQNGLVQTFSTDPTTGPTAGDLLVSDFNNAGTRNGDVTVGSLPTTAAGVAPEAPLTAPRIDGFFARGRAHVPSSKIKPWALDSAEEWIG